MLFDLDASTSQEIGVASSICAHTVCIFGFPKDRCAKILIDESKRFLEDGVKNTSIQTIEFCIFDDETLGYFRSEFGK
jgi:O-acetyl-ADP-ribose deacetylase (regulator of RNase III)